MVPWVARLMFWVMVVTPFITYTTTQGKADKVPLCLECHQALPDILWLAHFPNLRSSQKLSLEVIVNGHSGASLGNSNILESHSHGTHPNHIRYIVHRDPLIAMGGKGEGEGEGCFVHAFYSKSMPNNSRTLPQIPGKCIIECDITISNVTLLSSHQKHLSVNHTLLKGISRGFIETRMWGRG